MSDFILYYIKDLSIHELNITSLWNQGITDRQINQQYSIILHKLKTKSTKMSNGYFTNRDDCLNELNDQIKLNNSSFRKINNKFICTKCNNSYNFLSDIKSLDFKCTKCENNKEIQKLTDNNFTYITSGKCKCNICGNVVSRSISELEKNNFSCYHCESTSILKDIESKISEFNLVIDKVDTLQSISLSCNIHNEIVYKGTSNTILKTTETLCEKCKLSNIQSQIDTFNSGVSIIKYHRYDDIRCFCKVCNNTFKSRLSAIESKSLRCDSHSCRKTHFNKYYRENYNLPDYLEIQEYKSVGGEYHMHCKKCDSDFIIYNANIHKCPECEKKVSGLENILIEWMNSDPKFNSINFLVRKKIKAHMDEMGNITYYSTKTNNEYKKLPESSRVRISELDIYFPDHKFAIEVNGLAYHTIPNIYGKIHRWGINIHSVKYEGCKQLGIDLLQIHDLHFDNLDLIKSMISHKLGINDQRVFARKCIIKPVSSKDSEIFLNNNHIQGYKKIKYREGLYFNNELIALICIGYNKKENSHVIERYCQKTFINIPGGFSKLLKHCIEKYNIKKLFTFSDNMYSSGNLYKNNGFIKSEERQPITYSYYYHKKNSIRHKCNYRKDKIKKNKQLIYNDTETETANMIANGYRLYYDAGKVKWIYNP